MRICLHTDAALSLNGPRPATVDALARQFQGFGHDVTVVAPGPQRSCPYRVVSLPRFLGRWRRRWLLALYRRERFDIVHYHRSGTGTQKVHSSCGIAGTATLVSRDDDTACTILAPEGPRLASLRATNQGDWRATATAHLALYKELHAEQERRVEHSYPPHSARARGLRRLARNLARTPMRLLSSLARHFRVVHRLQRQADRGIPRLFGGERLRDLEAVPGPTSARKCRLLAHLAYGSPPGGCFVEIGAYMGKSTAWLVEAAQQRSDRPIVVSIDPHLLDTWEIFQGTVSQFNLPGRGLEFHRAFSHELGATWNRPISFLWIDGSHRYADVVSDIEDFLPHVIPGGWIVFDDAVGGHCPGVEKAIAERVQGRAGVVDVGTIKSFHLFRRADQPCESASCVA